MDQSSSYGASEDNRWGITRWSLPQVGFFFVVLLFGGALGIGGLALFNRAQPAAIVIVPPLPTATPLPTVTPSPVRVYVNGAVATPDVYWLAYDGIVQDAVAAAGGFAPEAYTDPINLARPLTDGMQVYVPLLSEASEWAPTVDDPLVVNNRDEAVVAEGEGDIASGPININTASAAELEMLPGVGPSTAAKIVAYRDEHGVFASIEAIMDVSGIGAGKFEGMQAFIVVE